VVRYLCAVAIAWALAAAGESGLAADPVADFYSRTTMRMLISADPGGSYDSDSRLVGRHLGKHLPGNPKIVMENMIGASGRVAANYMYRSAPRDGSVIATVQQSIAMAQAVGESGVQYDAAQFNWIGSPVRPDEVLVVWHTTGMHTIEEAKQRQVVIGATSPPARTTSIRNSPTSSLAPSSRSSPATRARSISIWRWSAARSRAAAPIRGANGRPPSPIGCARARSFR
jgi:hypothetical protein